MTQSATALPRSRRILCEGIEAGLHLGAQLLVSVDGEVLADLAVGESRPGVALSPSSPMLWLSSTKPIVAVAVAQQWERGRLHLDDPIARHIPEFAQGGKENISIRHVLTHTAGLRHLVFGWPEDSWSQIIANLSALRIEPRWVPGEKAGYHVASTWFLLAEIVRRVDGRPFEDYVREEIFLPLGMEDSWIGVTPERYRQWGNLLSPVWNTAKKPFVEHPWTQENLLTRPMPGGNGVGPARELARFYLMLDEGGTLDDTRILSPQSVEALTSRHRVNLYDHTFKAPMDWGLGFIPNSSSSTETTLPYHYGRYASRRTFGHSGNRSSVAFADPELHLVVALITNGTPTDAVHRERANRIIESIYEEIDYS